MFFHCFIPNWLKSDTFQKLKITAVTIKYSNQLRIYLYLVSLLLQIKYISKIVLLESNFFFHLVEEKPAARKIKFHQQFVFPKLSDSSLPAKPSKRWRKSRKIRKKNTPITDSGTNLKVLFQGHSKVIEREKPYFLRISYEGLYHRQRSTGKHLTP